MKTFLIASAILLFTACSPALRTGTKVTFTEQLFLPICTQYEWCDCVRHHGNPLFNGTWESCYDWPHVVTNGR